MNLIAWLLLLQSGTGVAPPVQNGAAREDLLTRRMILITEFATAKLERIRKEEAIRALRDGKFDAAGDATLGALANDYNDAEKSLNDIRQHYPPDSPDYRAAVARKDALEVKLRSARENLLQYFEAELQEALAKEQRLAQALQDIQRKINPPQPAPDQERQPVVRVVEKQVIVEKLRDSVPPNTGATKVNPKDGLIYVFVAPGTFQMGCVDGDHACKPEELPAHAVTLTKGFWIGQTEVPLQAYLKFGVAPPKSKTNPGSRGTQNPVINITFEQASQYCQKAGGRLPTEAEWEYAAKADKPNSIYPWGPEADHEYANFRGKSRSRNGRDQYEMEPAPVRTFPANDWNLNDMNGNVAEMVSDFYAQAYPAGPQTDPSGPENGKARVVRGGSFLSDPRDIRTTARDTLKNGYSSNYVGFRCVVDQLAQ